MTKKGRIEIKQGRLYFLGLQVRTKQRTSCLESLDQGSSRYQPLKLFPTVR